MRKVKNQKTTTITPLITAIKKKRADNNLRNYVKSFQKRMRKVKNQKTTTITPLITAIKKKRAYNSSMYIR